jgi:predicted lipoprotein with Yx(FWY)xxD motif
VRKTLIIAAAACLSLVFGAAPFHAAFAAEPVAKMPAGVQIKEITEPPSTVHKVLADANGMTLYTYDKDEGGKSTCNDECAKFWPPLAADAAAKPVGAWTVINREDGSKQWAYKGKPVYTFLKDTRTWDFDGHNQPKDKPVWHFIVAGK